MLQTGPVDLIMDYVYIPEGKKEFHYIHIIFQIREEEQNPLLMLTTDEMISEGDLEGVFEALQREPFRKLRMNLHTDFDIYLLVLQNSQRMYYRILFQEDQATIKEMKLES